MSAHEVLISYTIFTDYHATKKLERADVGWHELAARIRDAKVYASKKDCPLISLAEFGDQRSDRDCLRHATNVRRVYGAEIDYDGEEIGLAEATTMLQRANIMALLYTSPSHTPEKPRWRVLLPFSEPEAPELRALHVARANRVLGGIATNESFSLSQSFFIGRVQGVEYKTAETTGRMIDQATELEPLYYNGAGNGETKWDPTTDTELRATFSQGEGRYQAMVKLSSRWGARGMSADDILAAFLTLLDQPGVSPFNADGDDLRVKAKELAQSAQKFNESRAGNVVRIDFKLRKKKLVDQLNELGIELTDKFKPYPNESNVLKVLASDVSLCGDVWWNGDNGMAMCGERALSDHDDGRILVELQDRWGFSTIGIHAVNIALTQIARRRIRYPLREWLEGLRWDRTERLSTWTADVYGCERSDYTCAVGRCWLTGMIARAVGPGCQLDTMVVLEGKQGVYKSTSLAILGGQWYSPITEAFGSREWQQCLAGVWVGEIADLSGFAGRELDSLKAAMTVSTDHYRRPYDRRPAYYPRMTEFIGTTNRDDWQHDDTGARRFLPLKVGEINLECLRAMREQLFAEALQAYRAGAKWWDVPRLTAEHEQEKRRVDDVWHEKVAMTLAIAGGRIRIPSILESIGVKPEHQEKRHQQRVASILRTLGWTRETTWKDGKAVKEWISPKDGKLTNSKN